MQRNTALFHFLQRIEYSCILCQPWLRFKYKIFFRVFCFGSQPLVTRQHCSTSSVPYSNSCIFWRSFFELCDTPWFPNIVRAKFIQSRSSPIVNANILNNRFYVCVASDWWKHFSIAKTFWLLFHFTRFGGGGCYFIRM